MRVSDYKLMPPEPSMYARSWIDHRKKNAIKLADWEHSKRWVQRHNQQITQWLQDGDERAFREIAEPEPVNHAAIALQAKMERQATHAYVKARMAGRFNTDSYDKHCEEQEIVRGFMALEEGA